MVLQSFKDIIQNKAYQIEEKDRKIFEQGDLQSFFGLNPDTDFIEFILYDVNNNQLPQEAAQGAFVRYIPLSTQTINNYFIVKTGTIMQKNQLPAEYFIDAERLVMEAGYNNGIFKTQVTLLNRRVGSYRIDDKLWIKEISPSRTEIKLLPLAVGVQKFPDLKERYSILVNDGDFREDTNPFLQKFLEKVTAKEIDLAIRSKYGDAFYYNLLKEYGIKSFSVLAQDIETTFKQACNYEFSNKYSDVADGKTYGLLKPTKQPLSLSKKEIVDTCYKILVQIINSKLPTPQVKLTTFDAGFDESLDPVTTALSRKTSDTTFNTNNPVLKTIDMIKITESGFSVVSQTTTTTTIGPTGGGGTGDDNGRRPNNQYALYRVIRKGIPATFEESLLQYTDSQNIDRTIQTTNYGFVGEFCALLDSFGGQGLNLYSISKGTPCGPSNLGGSTTTQPPTSGGGGGGGVDPNNPSNRGRGNQR